MVIGANLSGEVVKYFTVEEVMNWRSLWLFPAIMAGVIMLLFSVLFKESGEKQEEQP